MSITVKRLVRAGYIATRRDGDDGRRVGLTLTAAGAKVKEQNTILDPELVKRMFHPMRAAELEAALRGIECMAEYARVLLRQRKRGRDS
jgi:DNA-binding MarR family transcriptional regulator